MSVLSEAGPLSARRELDHQSMWRTMRHLVDRLFGVLESESVIDDCLDVLVDVLGADRGLILVLHADGGTAVVNARGQGKSLAPESAKR